MSAAPPSAARAGAGAAAPPSAAAAGAGAAAPPSAARAYHISNRELTKWGVDARDKLEMSRVGKFGKPTGLWYGYDTAWANSLRARSENVGAFKYLLPLREFTDDPTKPNPDAILRLSGDNFDTFLSTYHTSAYMVTMHEKLREFIMRYFMEGDESILDVLPRKLKNKIKAYIDEGDVELINEDGLLAVSVEGENGEIIIGGKQLSDAEIESYVNKIYERIEYKPLDARFIRYKWTGFWEAVSKDFAGVEFTGELIQARNAPRNLRTIGENIVDVTWLQFLDVVSGCIFHPETYFSGHLPQEFRVMEGGRYHRRTSRRTIHGRIIARRTRAISRRRRSPNRD